ncbi:hypothetical protein P7K49_014863 [Saguinus oedipus]|uniref:Uncharacterized protein n=1 Tax=Saguinus oedipus TaxID=9490 RepID=A0ABQ9V7L2_SAGOE|nr:hypothetical protein P7K49_014863 [Saguinus oedipus]
MVRQLPNPGPAVPAPGGLELPPNPDRVLPSPRGPASPALGPLATRAQTLEAAPAPPPKGHPYGLDLYSSLGAGTSSWSTAEPAKIPNGFRPCLDVRRTWLWAALIGYVSKPRPSRKAIGLVYVMKRPLCWGQGNFL